MLKFFKMDIRLCMEQSKGYEDGMSSKMRLYGLKRAPRRWKKKLNKVMKNFNFDKIVVCILHIQNDSRIIVTGYVDNFLHYRMI